MYKIIFRCCDIVNSVHLAPRVFGLDKKTIIKASFFSLYQSLQGYDYSIDIVGDRLSDEMLDYFSNFRNIVVHNHTNGLGNDGSIRETLRLATTFDENDWVFFCEDDYLFTPNAMEVIDTLIQERTTVLAMENSFTFPNMFIGKLETKPLMIFPSDQPSYYNHKRKYHSLLFSTSNSYWRQIPTVTFTFLMEGKYVRKYFDLLYRTSYGANDFYISYTLIGKLFYKFRPFLTITPMPSVAAHLHEGVLSPLMDWETIMKNSIEGYSSYLQQQVLSQ